MEEHCERFYTEQTDRVRKICVMERSLLFMTVVFQVVMIKGESSVMSVCWLLQC